MLTLLVPLGLAAETAVFALVGVLFLRRRGYTLAEAGAGAVLLLFMVLSLIHQVGFLIGSPVPGVIIELVALVAVLGAGISRWPALVECFQAAGGLIRREMVPGAGIALAWMAMVVLIGAGWRTAHPAASAAGVSEWTHGGLAWMTGTHPMPPLNGAGLFYHTARVGLPPQACGFGLLAHMALGCSTYAMARRYAWPAMALTVTLLVVSMPRLVWLAVHPSAELVSATAVAVCLVLLYRLVEQHQAWDLRFFMLGLVFSIHAHPMSAALALVMVLLLVVVMVRRHGWLLCRELIGARPVPTILILLPTLVLAQLPAFALNFGHGHPLFGTTVAFDTDGIIGATANLVRYLFISIDPTEAVRSALEWLVGLDLRRVMMRLYNLLVVSLFGRSGASEPFSPVFSGSGPPGFGPFAALLVLPALIQAALRGPRRLKALSVAWAGYLYLAALIIAWASDNLVVLTPVYAANGFMVAFFLPPWRLRRRGMRLLQVLFLLLLAGSLVHSGRSAF